MRLLRYTDFYSLSADHHTSTSPTIGSGSPTLHNLLKSAIENRILVIVQEILRNRISSPMNSIEIMISLLCYRFLLWNESFSLFVLLRSENFPCCSFTEKFTLNGNLSRVFLEVAESLSGLDRPRDEELVIHRFRVELGKLASFVDVRPFRGVVG